MYRPKRKPYPPGYPPDYGNPFIREQIEESFRNMEARQNQLEEAQDGSKSTYITELTSGTILRIGMGISIRAVISGKDKMKFFIRAPKDEPISKEIPREAKRNSVQRKS